MGLYEIMQAAGATRQQRDARDLQNRQQQRQDDQIKWQRQQALAEQDADDRAIELKAKTQGETRGANRDRFDAQLIQANPANAERVRVARAGAGLPELAGEGVVEGPRPEQDFAGPMAPVQGVQDPQQYAQSLQRQASGVLGAPDPATTRPRPITDDITRAVVDGQGIPRGDPRFGPAWTKEQRRQEAVGRRRSAAGASRFDLGDLTGQTKTKIQTDVRKADDMLSDLGAMEAGIEAAGGAEELANVGGRASSYLDSLMSVTVGVSGETNKALQVRTEAEAGIATFRNRMFNELSGAAVSESEMTRLMQSLPNVGDSAPQLKGKINIWRSRIRLKRERGIDAMLHGIRESGAISDPRAEAPHQAQTPQDPGEDDFLFGGN